MDSLVIPGLDIPTTKPRISAWSGKLLRNAIKLDTNSDGSFGKLRLKDSGNGSVQNSFFFQMDDINRFVSCKAHPSTSTQTKWKLGEVMSKVFNSVAEVMGTFFEEVTQIGESSEPSHRRSKRRGPSPHQGKGHKSDESDQPTEDSDYVLDESDEEYNEETSDSVHSSENEDKDAAVADGESEGDGESENESPADDDTEEAPADDDIEEVPADDDTEEGSEDDQQDISDCAPPMELIFPQSL